MYVNSILNQLIFMIAHLDAMVLFKLQNELVK